MGVIIHVQKAKAIRYLYKNNLKHLDFAIHFKDSCNNIYWLPILKKILDVGKAKKIIKQDSETCNILCLYKTKLLPSKIGYLSILPNSIFFFC